MSALVAERAPFPSLARAPIAVNRSLLDQATTPAERKKIQNLTVESIAPRSKKRIASYFDTGDKVRLTGVTARFGAGIPGKVQSGLHSIAADAYQGAASFRDNTIFHSHIDLRPHGGANGVYRFVLVPKPKNTGLLLIELVNSSPPAALTTSKLAAERTRFAGFGFRFGFGFTSAAMQTRLLTTMARIPDSVLGRVKGVTFKLSSNNQGMGGEAGHYDPNTHTVMLFQAALSKSFNSPDRGGADFFTAAVTHEVSHAVDFEAFRRAADAVAAVDKKIADAKAKLRALDRISTDDPLAGVDDDPAEKKERAQLEKTVRSLNSARNKAVAAQHAAKTHSAGKGFRKAAGSTAISKYGAGAAVENFAELLTLYILDPALLKSLRPDAHAYWRKLIP